MNRSYRTYDSAFLTGVAANVFLFVFLNLGSLDDPSEHKGILFPYHPPVWGFPFRMVNGGLHQWGYAALGNVAVFVISGFALGFIFQVTWSEFCRSRRSEKRRN